MTTDISQSENLNFNSSEFTIKKESKSEVINLVLDALVKQKQVLVFVNSKKAAEKTAEDITRALSTRAAELDLLSEHISKILPRPTEQCRRLSQCVKKGIAYHHAGLVSEQKELVEDSFKSGLIKVICCTPSLAYGVDTPAFRVIVRDLKRYGKRGMDYIPVLEYHQMAGRAGRPGKELFGEAVCIAQSDNEKENIFEKYVKGEPEEIFSKLAVEPVLRTYILSLIATEIVNTREKILSFFSKTFWAHQFQDMQKLEKIINKMLKLLLDYGFIVSERQTAEFSSANEFYNESSDISNNDNPKINNTDELFSNFKDASLYDNENICNKRIILQNSEKIRATIIGKRVSELYLDPYTAYKFIAVLHRSKIKAVNDISFLSAVCYTLEMRPLLTVKVKEYDAIQERIIELQSQLLIFEPSYYDSDYDMFINAMKTSFFLHDWINEFDEESLLNKYDIRPGEIRVKTELADWLLYSMMELAKLLKMQNIVKEISRLRYRIKYGAREELLALLQLKGIGRVRARKLFMHDIKDIGDIKKRDLTSLTQLLGKAVAEDIKQQVGENIKPEYVQVKLNKRKGDINLMDFE
jgi:helicase